MRKPFQEATVRWALDRLDATKGSRRVLVADEVGLGKTLVAQGIVESLLKRRREDTALRVFYLCSSLSIARQNRDRLLEILPRDERERALVHRDRISLLLEEPPTLPTRLRLYTLTPGTSFRAGTGIAEERIKLAYCTREALGFSAHEWFHRAFRVGVDAKRWPGLWKAGSLPAWFTPAFRDRFLERVKQAFPRREAYTEKLKDRVRSALEGEHPWRAVARLRSALILAIVEELAPDLVVFDEFQRFFEVLPTESTDEDEGEEDDERDDDERAREIVRALLGIGTTGATTKVVMLSATPYRMYTGAHERDDHHAEFYRLSSFLFGNEHEARELRTEFRAYREALSLGPTNDTAARTAKLAIEARLSRVMARTERASLLRDLLPKPEITGRKVDVRPVDIRAFAFVADSASPEMRSAVEPFWSSVPFTLQMMPRTDYVFRRDAQPAPLPRAEKAIRIRFDTIRSYREQEASHPRLRALYDALPRELLMLPWLPPSKPWWDLGGIFAEASSKGASSKALVFSRFRAVPRALATLLSYEAERSSIEASKESRGGRRYDYTTRSGHAGREGRAGDADLKPLPRPAFTMSAGRDWVREVAMFLPWPQLASLGDPWPLVVTPGQRLTHEEVRRVVMERLRAEFPGRPSSAAPVRAWRWALALERRGAEFASLERAVRAWRKLPDGSQALPNVALQAEAPSESELEELADLALCGPGPILLRAVRRVFGESSELDARLEQLCKVGVEALAGYLDVPEFHLLFAKKGGRRDRRAALRRAVWEGNLEAVLDEQLACEQGLGTTERRSERERDTLEALDEALRLRDTTLLVDRLKDRRGHAMRLRCHAAAAFGLRAHVEQVGDAPRNETLRVAFNSPFRPMVLVTTSIGQEGLDFHRWSNHLVHWDLPDNPVDLEQRDGRLNRYGNLAVRKQLSKDFDLVGRDPTSSPWHAIARESRSQDGAEGMMPWWFVPGAEIQRSLLVPSFSELARARDRLQLDLDYYRLALGQPDQEALVRRLQRGSASDATTLDWSNWLKQVAIDLKPRATTEASTLAKEHAPEEQRHA